MGYQVSCTLKYNSAAWLAPQRVVSDRFPQKPVPAKKRGFLLLYAPESYDGITNRAIRRRCELDVAQLLRCASISQDLRFLEVCGSLNNRSLGNTGFLHVILVVGEIELRRGGDGYRRALIHRG